MFSPCWLPLLPSAAELLPNSPHRAANDKPSPWDRDGVTSTAHCVCRVWALSLALPPYSDLRRSDVRVLHFWGTETRG